MTAWHPKTILDLFLASELSTHQVSVRMGVDSQKAVRWMKDSAGTMAAFQRMDAEILEKRRMNKDKKNEPLVLRPITD